MWGSLRLAPITFLCNHAICNVRSFSTDLQLTVHRYVLRKPWIWDNPWIVLRKAWIGRYPQFAQDNPWIAPRRRRRAVKRKPHLREVRPGAAEILSRLCLFVNSENSQLAKWCGLYSLSLSLSRPIGYGGPLTVGWQLTKDVSLISTGRQATAPNSLTGPLS